MKKSTAAVIVSALVITLGGTTALAFGQSGRAGYQNSVDRTADMVYNQNCKCGYCEEYGHQYTDTDNDGVCDYCTRNYESVSDQGVNGYHCISVSSCNGTGHHAGHRYGHR